MDISWNNCFPMRQAGLKQLVWHIDRASDDEIKQVANVLARENSVVSVEVLSRTAFDNNRRLRVVARCSSNELGRLRLRIETLIKEIRVHSAKKSEQQSTASRK